MCGIVFLRKAKTRSPKAIVQLSRAARHWVVGPMHRVAIGCSNNNWSAVVGCIVEGQKYDGGAEGKRDGREKEDC